MSQRCDRVPALRRLTSIPWKLCLSFIVLSSSSTAVWAADAIEHRGVVFVSLRQVLEPSFLDGEWTLAPLGKHFLDVRLPGGRRVTFEEGGDRAVVNGGSAKPLQPPILVLDGRHYIPAEASAPLLGYTVEKSPLALVWKGKRLPLDIESLDVPHFRTRVDDLRPVHRSLVLARPRVARPNLHAGTTPVRLDAGTALLARREVTLDGVPHALVTRNDASIVTYAVTLDALTGAARDAALQGSYLGRIFERLSGLADAQPPSGINHGPRAVLPKTVALTVDLCWSLRPAEPDFFRFLPRLAALDGGAALTLFPSGRWVEQYPLEMEKLIALGGEPGIDMTWGLHSWAHPKDGGFMNDFEPSAVREDNLRTERELLLWGVVPSIYYRFPGLKHDATRLRAILGLDLIPVDCDSWVASMRSGRWPHHREPADGSILLVHGNGNEPHGISRFYEWRIEHAGWRMGTLNRFVTPDGANDPRPTSGPSDSRDRRSTRRFR